jgi:hypothetical protein
MVNIGVETPNVQLRSDSYSIRPKTYRDKMKSYTIIAVFLIVLGIAAFAWQGISYTTSEKVVDLGPIHMTAEKTRTLPLPPIVGGICLVGGIGLLVMGRKKG